MKTEECTDPDFQVKWRKDSENLHEEVYCVTSKMAPVRKSSSKLRDAVAVLHTDTTYIEVSEVSFDSPVNISFTPFRPGFSLLSSASSMTHLHYGYQNESHREARLENVLFMLPGREISGNCSAGTFRTVTCSYDPHYAERILGPLDDITPAQLSRALDMKSPFINCTLLRLMNEAIFPGPISKTMLETLGCALLAECKHWMLAGGTQAEEKGKLSARHVEIIETYLSTLTAKAPSVVEIAKACGFSERYFAKLFRQQFGHSISSYLKSSQINRAKSYLVETDLPLKEIAHRLGFSSVPSFSVAFRAAAGVTPGQFRKVA